MESRTQPRHNLNMCVRAAQPSELGGVPEEARKSDTLVCYGNQISSDRLTSKSESRTRELSIDGIAKEFLRSIDAPQHTSLSGYDRKPIVADVVKNATGGPLSQLRSVVTVENEDDLETVDQTLIACRSHQVAGGCIRLPDYDDPVISKKNQRLVAAAEPLNEALRQRVPDDISLSWVHLVDLARTKLRTEWSTVYPAIDRIFVVAVSALARVTACFLTEIASLPEGPSVTIWTRPGTTLTNKEFLGDICKERELHLYE